MLEEFKNIFRTGNAVVKLIIVNLIVFLLSGLIDLFLFLSTAEFQNPVQYLALPADLSRLPWRMWSPLTYMFVHAGFFHILFNMVMLFFGGRIFMDLIGNRRLTSTYLAGGLAGGIFFIVSYNAFPAFTNQVHGAVLVGASASVLSILVAAATISPNYGVRLFMFPPIPLKYIAIFLIVMDLISIPADNPGGRLAHLGGALYGFIFALQYKRGRNITEWLDKLLYRDYKIRRQSKMKVVHRKKTRTDTEYLDKKRALQLRMDQILDKISKSGYESLTAEEKEILFKMSKDL